ncbi:MAG: hypothetical protein ACT4OE_00075 [Sphingosinicella sp.]
MPEQIKTRSRIFVGFIGSVWGLSLVLPVVAFAQPSGEQVWQGWSILALGWMGLFGLQFGWLANPFFIAACALIATGKDAGRWQMAIGILMVLLLIDAWTWNQMPTEMGYVPVTRYYSGYFIWFLPVGSAAIWLLTFSLKRRKAAAPGERSQ